MKSTGRNWRLNQKKFIFFLYLNCISNLLISGVYGGKSPKWYFIDEIIVSGPNGDLPVSKDDFSLYAKARDLCVSIPGSPAVGTYTFTVISRNRQGTATDTQSVIRPMTVPDDSTFRPAEGETVTSINPTFSWGAVEYLNQPIYYLFQLYDSSDKEICRRGRRQNLTSHTLPAGILKPGQTYRWRVRISDSGHWLEEQNRSETKMLTFTMAARLE